MLQTRSPTDTSFFPACVYWTLLNLRRKKIQTLHNICGQSVHSYPWVLKPTIIFIIALETQWPPITEIKIVCYLPRLTSARIFNAEWQVLTTGGDERNFAGNLSNRKHLLGRLKCSTIRPNCKTIRLNAVGRRRTFHRGGTALCNRFHGTLTNVNPWSRFKAFHLRCIKIHIQNAPRVRPPSRVNNMWQNGVIWQCIQLGLEHVLSAAEGIMACDR